MSSESFVLLLGGSYTKVLYKNIHKLIYPLNFSLFIGYFSCCICFLMDHDHSVFLITSTMEVSVH